MKETISRKPLNLTQLRKNKRKRQDKTSGRKRPRTNDVDVEPAGDADEDIVAIIADVVADSDDVEPALEAVYFHFFNFISLITYKLYCLFFIVLMFRINCISYFLLTACFIKRLCK